MEKKHLSMCYAAATNNGKMTHSRLNSCHISEQNISGKLLNTHSFMVDEYIRGYIRCTQIGWIQQKGWWMVGGKWMMK